MGAFTLIQPREFRLGLVESTAECNEEAVDNMHFVCIPPTELAQWNDVLDGAKERGERLFQRRDKRLAEHSPGDWITHATLVITYGIARRLHRERLMKTAPFWFRVPLWLPGPRSLLAFGCISS